MKRTDKKQGNTSWLMPAYRPRRPLIGQSAMFLLLIALPSMLAHLASAQATIYDAGTPMEASFVAPSSNDQFADSSFDPGLIYVTVRFSDYDSVTYTSADGTTPFTNKERGLDLNADGTARYTVKIEKVLPDGTKILLAPIGPPPSRTASYSPTLPEGVNEEVVTVRCTIIDNDTNPARRDLDKVVTPDLSFTIVRRPSINISVTPVKEDDGDVPPVGTPTSSGYAADAGVKLQFGVSQRAGSWTLAGTDVSWTTPWGEGTGLTFTTPLRIPASEEHRRFSCTATATFRLVFVVPFPPYVYNLAYTDTKTRSATLAFDKTGHDELNDTSRGIVEAQQRNPPNWFDDRPSHWGNFISRFNEQADYLQPNPFIVYYAPYLTNQAHLFGYTDYFAEHAPNGTPNHRYDPAYRGRIYLLDKNLDFGDQNSSNIPYTPRAGGIDFMAQVVAHEFSHRDMFINQDNWGGFSNLQIGGPVQWGGPGFFYPRSGMMDFDRDGDALRDSFENAHAMDFHFDRLNPYSTLQWWTGNNMLTGLDDDEMHAMLWGSWSFLNGILDAFWSAPLK